MSSPADRRHDRFRERSPGDRAAIPQDLIFGPPPPEPKRPLSWMVSHRTRNLAIAAALPIVVVFLAVRGIAPDGTTSRSRPSLKPSPPPTAAPPAPRFDGALKSYAISLPEMNGLAPDASPGSRLQLWVAWEPPLTKGPRVQMLTDGVVLERIAPPSVPEAPATALLLVPPKAIDRIIYGDLFGRLSVVGYGTRR